MYTRWQTYELFSVILFIDDWEWILRVKLGLHWIPNGWMQGRNSLPTLNKSSASIHIQSAPGHTFLSEIGARLCDWGHPGLPSADPLMPWSRWRASLSIPWLPTITQRQLTYLMLSQSLPHSSASFPLNPLSISHILFSFILSFPFSVSVV